MIRYLSSWKLMWIFWILTSWGRYNIWFNITLHSLFILNFQKIIRRPHYFRTLGRQASSVWCGCGIRIQIGNLDMEIFDLNINSCEFESQFWVKIWQIKHKRAETVNDTLLFDIAFPPYESHRSPQCPAFSATFAAPLISHSSMSITLYQFKTIVRWVSIETTGFGSAKKNGSRKECW